MKRFCLLIATAALCGCHPPMRDRPLAPLRLQLPHNPDVTVEPTDTPAPHHAIEDPLIPLPEPEPKLPRPVSVIVEETNRRLEDAFFAYDRSDAEPEALDALRRDAQILAPVLSDFPHLKVAIEGHCDERGSAEYNLALGDRRATRALEILRQFGIPAAPLVPISYGKESPQCIESSESCWRRNRRAHLVLRTP